MSGSRFTLDANILFYSVDAQAGRRQRSAAEILDRAAECDCRLTLQAISEFFFAVTRKGIVARSEAAAQAEDWLILFPCAQASPSAVRTALAAAGGGQASYWDALLRATAAEAGCATIVTEGLADGGQLGGLSIINPFTADGGLTPAILGLLGAD